MNEQKSIILVLGVAGQVYTARGLEQEFGYPVTGVVNFARLDEHLDAEKRAVFKNIYSLPAYYLANIDAIRALSREELDRQHRALEEKLGVSRGTLLVHYDRALRWCDDYLKVRHYQLAVLRFVDDLFQKENPVFILDGVVTYLQHILRHACRKKDIPYFMTRNGRGGNRFEVVHENGHIVGMEESFRKLQGGDLSSLPASLVKEADEIFDAFVKKPQRPAYSLRNSNVKFNPKRLMKALRYALDPARIFSPEKVKLVDQSLNYEYRTPAILWHGIRGKMRRLGMKALGVFETAPDLNVPYIYLTLHYTPEISDMYAGTEYDHHAGFVSQFAKHIPPDTQLYVKEHTSMLGRRPIRFYKEIAALYNVRMLDPAIDTFTLIQNSRAVATVTGTAGWEGFLLSKPVIALGDVHFNFLPGVLHTPLNKDFSVKLDRFLKEFRSDQNISRNGYRAYYACTYPGWKGDIGNDITLNQAPDNARTFARGLRQCIQTWQKEIPGTFPEKILNSGKADKNAA